MNSQIFRTCITLAVLTLATDEIGAEPTYRSRHPMRPLPVPASRSMDKAAAYFVDPVRGDDRHEGTEQRPWKTINRAVNQRQGGPLKAGDILYLRGGTYYERVTVTVRGTADTPITIRSYPGELAIIDGGLREFYEDPANAWEPVPDGAEGEFRSTKSYAYGGGFGNFGDSMVPLHRYLHLTDLRSRSELWRKGLNDRHDDPQGLYCGPGVWRNPETGRIHIRLSHTQLAGLGERHYRGETDPRRLPLVIAGHDYALQIEGARHLRLQDLVVRGAQRAAVSITEDAEDIERDAEDIELDGLTLYGSDAALQTRRVRGLRVLNCALRGHAAPWHSRAHHKYRAQAGYLVYVRGSDIEIAHCELTDHHDCIQLYFADEVRFHHNLVDNFNDDGIEAGPKKERGKTYIYQNHISRCLNPFTLHGDKPKPVATEPGHGVYIYRNVVDFRQGVYRAIPAEPDSTGDYLNSPTSLLAHDHGGPIHPVYYVYHNTFLLPHNMFRNVYLYSWGAHTRGTTRRVFNNIFVQVEGLPGQRIISITADDDFQEDANLMWSLREGPDYRGDFFAKFRSSPFFEATRKHYPSGWGARDLFADPRFVHLDIDAKRPSDLRLQTGSPAINAGVELPAEWPDPMREFDRGKPDLGALPLGAEILQIGPVASP